MKSEEFLKEVVKSKKCPKNFEQIYKKFTFYQELADDTLNAFHYVCEKNNIHYQLAYGSLLGAIRDGGQIPWDYDVDVFVPLEEKKELINALKKDLDKRFYFYCPESDEKCRHMFIRLAPIGYRTEVLHVDVFYLIGLPFDENKSKELSDRIQFVSEKRYDKLVKYFDEQSRIRTFIYKFINKLRAINYNPHEEYVQLEEMCLKYSIQESIECTTFDTFASANKFNTSNLLESELIKTDIGEFRIPCNYDSILNSIYGNYNEIMPLESRLKEMMSSYKRLERYAKIK